MRAGPSFTILEIMMTVLPSSGSSACSIHYSCCIWTLVRTRGVFCHATDCRGGGGSGDIHIVPTNRSLRNGMRFHNSDLCVGFVGLLGMGKCVIGSSTSL